MKYKCIVADSNCKIKHINLSADSLDELKIKITSEGLIYLESVENKNKFEYKKYKKYLKDFTSLMEELISSGLNIKDALQFFYENNALCSDVTLFILEQINKGTSLSQSCRNFPEIFPDLYIELLRNGEHSGNISTVFQQLKEYIEFNNSMKEKIKGALIYPAIVLITAVCSIAAMVFFIFPRLQEMFLQFNKDAALQLINNINALKAGIALILVLMILCIIFIIIVSKVSKMVPSIKNRTDSIVLKLPFISKYILMYNSLYFCFATENLLKSGLPLSRALESSSNVCTNKLFRNTILRLQNKIEKGKSLKTAVMEEKILSEEMKAWISSGEKSGDSINAFSKLRNHFQKEIERTTKKIITVLEPAVTLLSGVIIMIITLTVIVPVFSLYGEIL